MQNTSTEKSDNYKEIYSEFLGEIVKLHNYHEDYLFHQGHATARKVRTHCGSMAKLLKKLRDANADAYEEEKANKLVRRDNRSELRGKGINNKKLAQSVRTLRIKREI
jgi:cytochrome c553